MVATEFGDGQMSLRLFQIEQWVQGMAGSLGNPIRSCCHAKRITVQNAGCIFRALSASKRYRD